jgi:hypothetical protein
MENSISPRLQHLIDSTGRQLSDFIPGEISGQEAIDLFANADPSRNKSATQWLITTYLNQGFRFEDIQDGKDSKVCETLTLFGMHKRKLSVTQRNLNQYKTLAEVWKSIEGFVTLDHEISGRAVKREAQNKAYGETEFLHQDHGFKVLVPLTEFASQWWGKGTRWCTAAKKNCYFNQYNAKAPLIIFVMPDGVKFQLFVSSRDFQLCNDSDEVATEDDLKPYLDYLTPYLTEAVKSNLLGRGNLAFLDIFTEDFYFQAVSRPEANPFSLGYIPVNVKTKAICLKAIETNIQNLIHHHN